MKKENNHSQTAAYPAKSTVGAACLAEAADVGGTISRNTVVVDEAGEMENRAGMRGPRVHNMEATASNREWHLTVAAMQVEVVCLRTKELHPPPPAT